MRNPASALFCAWALFLIATPAAATRIDARIEACLRDAADYQKVPREWLFAIANWESRFNPSAVNHNKNGTIDHGLMQVNSWWLDTIADFGITEKDLYDPCINANVGAWILAQSIKQFGLTNEALGSYNTGPKGKDAAKLLYVEKVVNAWNKRQ